MTARRTPPPAITVQAICTAMETWAPRHLAYDWDKPGLSIGDPNKTVSRISVMLSVTPETVATALKAKADLIISHHPVIWEPLTHLCETDAHTRMCLQLARSGIACYAAHTNLDMAAGGVNDTLAKTLGLVHCKPLFPRYSETTTPNGHLKVITFVPPSHLDAVRNAVCHAGAGIIGNYTYCTFTAPGTGTFLPGKNTRPFSGKPGALQEDPEFRLEVMVDSEHIHEVLNALNRVHPYETPAIDIIPLENSIPPAGLGIWGELPETASFDQFARHVRTALKRQYIRMAANGRRMVKQVAVLGGAGGSRAAHLPPNVEVYVTGDIGYHDALLLQERGIAVVDAGHDGTESGIVPVVAGFLKQRFKGLRITAHPESELFQVMAD